MNNDINYAATGNEVLKARDTMMELVDSPDSAKISFLTDIHNRGETPAEIAGFAMALRESRIQYNLFYQPGLCQENVKVFHYPDIQV